MVSRNQFQRREGVDGPRCAARPRGVRRRRGLTLIELMVGVALVSAVILVVANVFSTASGAAGRTVAHTELLDSAGTFERSIRGDVGTMAPGFLMIYSPTVDRTVSGNLPLELRLPPNN